MADTQEKLLRYKAYLERNSDGEKVLHIFKKITRLPITVQILQNTGIGKVVNSFRKTDGEIGAIAKSIVTGWKTLVSEEAQRLVELEQNNDIDQSCESVNQLDNTFESPPSKQHIADSEFTKTSDADKTQTSRKHSSGSKHRSSSKHRENRETVEVQSKSRRENKLGETVNAKNDNKERKTGEKESGGGSEHDSKHREEKSDKHRDGKSGGNKHDSKKCDEKSTNLSNHSDRKNSNHGDRKNSDSKRDKHSSNSKHDDRHNRHLSNSKHAERQTHHSKHSETHSSSNNPSDKHSNDSNHGDKKSDKDSKYKHSDRKSSDSKHSGKSDITDDCKHSNRSSGEKKPCDKKDSSKHSDSDLADQKGGDSKQTSKQCDKKTADTKHSSSKTTSSKHKNETSDKEKSTTSTHDVNIEKKSDKRKESELKKKSEDKNAYQRKHKSVTEIGKIETNSVKCQEIKTKVMERSMEKNGADSYCKLDSDEDSSIEQSHDEDILEKRDIFSTLFNPDMEILAANKKSTDKKRVDSIKKQSDITHPDKVKQSSHKSSSKSHDNKSQKSNTSSSHKHSSKTSDQQHKSDVDDAKRSGKEKDKHKTSKTNDVSHSSSKHSSKSHKKSHHSGSHENKEVSFGDALSIPQTKSKKSSSEETKRSEQTKRKAESDYEQLKAKFKVQKKVDVNEQGMSKKRRAESDHQELLSEPTASKQLKLPDEEFSYMLPETSAHYRPWRFSELSEKKTAMAAVDPAEMALKSYSRTQMYSGRKHTGVTEMFSLFEICIKVLMNNIDSLEYVGGVPFDILKPVLEKCTVEQLYRLEDFNPVFLEDTDYLWKAHSEKDFRGNEPDEMESWRELYMRKYDEREAKLKQLKNNIADSMAKAVPVRTTKLAYVHSTVKPPREVRRQQIKYGTASASVCKSSVRAKFASAMEVMAPSRNHKQTKPVAPMMQKTMKFMKSLKRR